MKKTENSFVFLCNKLEKESCSICMVRKAVKEYVGTDYDKFLQLKAEAEDGGYYEHVNTLLAGGAFIISVLSIVCNCIIDTASKIMEIYKGELIYERIAWISIIVAIVLIAIAGIYPMWKVLRRDSVGKSGCSI